MICPRCGCPGALIAGKVVRCIARACRWFDQDSYRKWREAMARGDYEFSGDPMADSMRHVWERERADREARDKAAREASDDA